MTSAVTDAIGTAGITTPANGRSWHGETDSRSMEPADQSGGHRVTSLGRALSAYETRTGLSENEKW